MFYDNDYIDNLDELSILNNEALHNLHESLTDDYISLINLDDQTNNMLLVEASIDKIIQYIEQVSQNATQVWNNFKIDYTNSLQNIQATINKNNMMYYTSRFRMKLPVKYLIPNILRWNDIRDNCNIQVIQETTYNQMKPALDNIEAYENQYYRSYIERGSKNIKKALYNRVFTYAKGNEIINSNIILQYVNFLSNYNNEVQAVGGDIDKLNRSSANIKKMLAGMPRTEATNMILDIYDYLNEAEGVPKKVKTISLMTKNGNSIKNKNLMPGQPKPKSDNVYIRNYYRVSMQVFSAKMKICTKLKNQSIKMCNQFIKLQPKNTNTQTPINPGDTRNVTIQK